METMRQTKGAGRSLARLVSALVSGADGVRYVPDDRVIEIPDASRDHRFEALRELQALDATWDASRPEEARDIRWLD